MLTISEIVENWKHWNETKIEGKGDAAIHIKQLLGKIFIQILQYNTEICIESLCNIYSFEANATHTADLTKVL